MSDINISEKFEPLFEIPPDVDLFIVTGGRNSQKSFAVSLSSVSSCAKYGHRILYSRYTNASLKDSIYAEVEEKVEMLNLENQFTLTTNRIESNFNKSKIVFKGLKAGSNQQTANLKGLKDFSMWVLDEAEELTDEPIFDKIYLSIRGNKKTDPQRNIKILILNPASKEHFIYKKYFEAKGVPGGFNGIKDNVCYIHTTYLDCLEFVSDEIVDFFKEMQINNPTKYNHIVLGGWLDKAEGVVFSNWKIGEFDTSLPEIYGQDYGYANDPSTLVKVAVDQSKKIIYLDECFYLQAQSTSQIIELNKRYAGKRLIVGDNAEPRLIAELRQNGVNIKPSEKGPDSIRIGISRMLDYDIIVTTNSINLIKELNNYVWNDKKSQTPIDMYNHLLDAVRYALEVFNAPKRIPKKRNYINLN